ncbi:MAG: hypothetical protein ABI949_12805 [Ilumatobacteraceae bacterium]
MQTSVIGRNFGLEITGGKLQDHSRQEFVLAGHPPGDLGASADHGSQAASVGPGRAAAR